MNSLSVLHVGVEKEGGEGEKIKEYSCFNEVAPLSIVRLRACKGGEYDEASDEQGKLCRVFRYIKLMGKTVYNV